LAAKKTGGKGGEPDVRPSQREEGTGKLGRPKKTTPNGRRNLIEKALGEGGGGIAEMAGKKPGNWARSIGVAEGVEQV